MFLLSIHKRLREPICLPADSFLCIVSTPLILQVLNTRPVNLAPLVHQYLLDRQIAHDPHFVILNPSYSLN